MRHNKIIHVLNNEQFTVVIVFFKSNKPSVHEGNFQSDLARSVVVGDHV